MVWQYSFGIAALTVNGLLFFATIILFFLKLCHSQASGDSQTRSYLFFWQLLIICICTNVCNVVSNLAFIVEISIFQLMFDLSSAFLVTAFSCFLWHSYSVLYLHDSKKKLFLKATRIFCIIIPTLVFIICIVDGLTYPDFFQIFSISLVVLVCFLYLPVLINTCLITRASKSLRSESPPVASILRSMNLMVFGVAILLIIAGIFYGLDIIQSRHFPPVSMSDTASAGLLGVRFLANVLCVNYCRVLLKTMRSSGNEYDSFQPEQHTSILKAHKLKYEESCISSCAFEHSISEKSEASRNFPLLHLGGSTKGSHVDSLSENASTDGETTRSYRRLPDESDYFSSDSSNGLKSLQPRRNSHTSSLFE